eukprot:5549538-Alexandrium_andersonii.AAC.1
MSASLVGSEMCIRDSPWRPRSRSLELRPQLLDLGLHGLASRLDPLALLAQVDDLLLQAVRL